MAEPESEETTPAPTGGVLEELESTAESIRADETPQTALGDRYTELWMAGYKDIGPSELQDPQIRLIFENDIVASLEDRGEAYREIVRDELIALAGGASGYLPNPLHVNVVHAVDPVALVDGQFVHESEDLNVAGAGIDFVMRRTYRSRIAYSGPLGANWDHAYNVHLIANDDHLRVSTGELREQRFVRHPVHGYFVPPDGIDAVVDEAGDSFIRRDADGTRHIFEPDPAVPRGHRLVRIEDRFGNFLAFTHADGLLVRVLVNHPARVVRLDHDELGRIVAVHDHTGRRWRYSYDDHGDLVTVTTPPVDADPAGLTTTYEYTTAGATGLLAHALTRVVDAAGRSYVENEYGAEPGQLTLGRVVRQRQGHGETLFEYENVDPVVERDYDPSHRPTAQTIVTHRSGQRVHHIYNEFGNLLHRQEFVADGGRTLELVDRHRYNADGQIVGSLSAEGTLLQRLYGRDHFLRVTGLTDDEVATDDRLTAAVRLGFGRVLSTVRRARKFDLSALDLQHGVWGDFPDILSGFDPDGADIVVKHTFEPSYGQPLTISDPRFTRSPDPDALNEDPRHEETLTSYLYDGPPGDPSLFLVEIRRPRPTAADGTPGPATVESFRDASGQPAYDERGRQLQRTDPLGVVTDFTYIPNDPADPRSGFLRETVIDRAGLEARTQVDPDMLGRPVATTLPRAAETQDGRFESRTRFDALDRPVETVTTLPFGFRMRFSYDRCGQLTREERDLRDVAGNPMLGGVGVRVLEYDEEFNVLQEEIGGGSEASRLCTRHSYDGAGRRVLTLLPNGERIAYFYNERGLPAGQRLGAGTADAATTRSEYDADGRLHRAYDARGNRTEFTYDAFGRVVAEEGPLGHVLRRDHDKLGNPTVERFFERRADDAYVLLSRRVLVYDELGRLVTTTADRFPEPSEPVAKSELEDAFRASPGPGTPLVSQTFYDAGGRVTRTVDPRGRTTQSEYDALGRPVLSIDPLGHRSEEHYDLHGNLLRRDDVELLENGGRRVFSSRFIYDELDRVVATVDGLGNLSQHRYDSRGNEVERIDPLGNVVRTEYDLYNRRAATTQVLTSTGLGDGNVIATSTTRHEYDDGGRLTGTVDPLGRRIRHRYDALGRRTATIFPDRTVLHFDYDADGHLAATTDGNGVRRTYTIDPEGHTTGVDVHGRPELREEYSYDGRGRCVSETNAVASREITFDSTGLPVAERTTLTIAGSPPSAPREVRREFDESGDPLAVVHPGGRRLEFDRDPGGRLLRIRNTANGAAYPGDPSTPEEYELARFGYAGRRRETCTYANAAAARWARDAAGRVIQLEHSADAPLLTIQTLHDASGQLRLHQERGPAEVVERFGYDSAGQLAEQRPGPFIVFDPAEFAAPGDPIDDAVQPRIDAVLGTLALPDGPRSFSYDLAGNREAERRDGGEITYVVNDLDQYTERDGVPLVHDDNGNLVDDGSRQYAYDSRNRLTGISRGGIELLRVLRDASGRPVAEIAGGRTTELVYDGDEVVAEFHDGDLRALFVYDDGTDRPLQVAADGAEHYFHVDHLGTVRALTDRAGALAVTYRFTGFGVPVGSDPDLSPYNPVRFAGRRLHALNGVYDCRARAYDPMLGRFLQRDPAGHAGAINLYAYVGNAPTRFVDPTGAYRTEFGCEHCYGYAEAAREYVERVGRMGGESLAAWQESGLLVPPEPIPTRALEHATRSRLAHVFHTALPAGVPLTGFERRLLDHPKQNEFRVVTDLAGNVAGYEFEGVRNTDFFTRTGVRVSSRWFESGLEEPDFLPSLVMGGLPQLIRRGPAIAARGFARAFSGRASRSGFRPLTNTIDEVPTPLVQPTVTIGPSPTAPRPPRPTVDLPHVGERPLDHGTRVHQELPRIARETNPGVSGEFNVAPGLTGPDLANPVRLNATFGEMKSLWDRQSRILRQARRWGYEPETGRIWFYDRNTGLVFEGIIQTDKFPSGRFRP